MKKILTVLVCCLLGIVKVSAAENDSNVVFDYIDNIYSNRQIGEQFYTGEEGIIRVNGKIAYCLDPTIRLKNDVYSSSGDFKLANISEEQLNYLEVVSHFGYGYNNRWESSYYLATQEIIWEYLTNGEVYWTDGKGGAVVNIDSYKQEIIEDVNRYLAVPEFPEYLETYIGEDIVLENKTGSLEYYRPDLWLATIDGNKLTLSAECKGTTTIHLDKKSLNYQASYVYMSENSQTLATFGYSGGFNNSVEITYKVKTLTKLRIIKKESETNKIIKNRETKIKIFDVTNNRYITENGNDVFTIGDTGILETTIDFEEGEYQIEEITAPQGYKKLEDAQTFSIYEYHGPMTEIVIYNRPYLYNIIVHKKAEVFKGFEIVDKKVQALYSFENISDVEYGLYAKEDIWGADGNALYTKDELIATINIQDGIGTVNGIPYGRYYLKEISCKEEYELDNTLTDIIPSEKQFIEYTFYNYLKKGNLTIRKVDGDKGLQGAEFLFSGKKYPFSSYLRSDALGYIVLEGIPYDNYIVKETKAPIGYLLDTEEKEISLYDSEVLYDFENQKSDPEEPEVPKEPQPPKDPDIPEKPVIPEDPELPEKPESPKEPDIPKEPVISEELESKEEVVSNPNTAVSKKYEQVVKRVILYISIVLGIFKLRSKS